MFGVPCEQALWETFGESEAREFSIKLAREQTMWSKVERQFNIETQKGSEQHTSISPNIELEGLHCWSSILSASISQSYCAVFSEHEFLFVLFLKTSHFCAIMALENFLMTHRHFCRVHSVSYMDGLTFCRSSGLAA